MILTLEVVGQQAPKLAAASRMVFADRGGTIGRLPDNDWVLPDPYISGNHVRIRFVAGQFLLEDTSSNGVFLNSPQNRLPRNQSHVLRSGDRFFIDAYEIRATLSSANELAEAPELSGAGRSSGFMGNGASSLAVGGGETDPLKLLGLESPVFQSGMPSRVEDLNQASLLSQHFRPPSAIPPVIPPVRPEPNDSSRTAKLPSLIPDDYDPFAPVETPIASPQQSVVAPQVHEPRKSPSLRPVDQPVRELNSRIPKPAPAPPAQRKIPPAPATDSKRTPLSPPVSANQQANAPLDFSALLAAAGIEGVQLTPELAENFGKILRVVVSGLMDVLRARERIKDEFRMHMTTFKTVDNNPLKFSANVDDALHNLLVKRNAAFLGPVEAFEDAFVDVRHHQMAMLAGMRVAFESMMNEFEPEQLQEQFNRQIKKGSILSAPARLRYWDLYRDRFHDMVKDPDANFRDLFGDEFAKAYEEQLQRLRTKQRADER